MEYRIVNMRSQCLSYHTWSVAPVQLTEEISLHLRGNGVVSDSDGVAGGVETRVTRCEGELSRQELEDTPTTDSVTFLRLVLSRWGST